MIEHKTKEVLDLLKISWQLSVPQFLIFNTILYIISPEIWKMYYLQVCLRYWQKQAYDKKTKSQLKNREH